MHGYPSGQQLDPGLPFGRQRSLPRGRCRRFEVGHPSGTYQGARNMKVILLIVFTFVAALAYPQAPKGGGKTDSPFDEISAKQIRDLFRDRPGCA